MHDDHVSEKEFSDFLQKNPKVREFMKDIYPGKNDEGITTACREFNNLVQQTSRPMLINPFIPLIGSTVVIFSLFITNGVGKDDPSGAFLVSGLLGALLTVGVGLIDLGFDLGSQKKPAFKELKELSKRYEELGEKDQEKMKKIVRTSGLTANF